LALATQLHRPCDADIISQLLFERLFGDSVNSWTWEQVREIGADNWKKAFRMVYAAYNSLSSWEKERLSWQPHQLGDNLIFFADRGQLVLCKLFVARGADVNYAFALVPHRTSVTPLLMALLKNHHDVVKFLLEKGADANYNAGDRTLLSMYASTPPVEDTLKIGQLFLTYVTKKTIDMLSTDDVGGETALMVALNLKNEVIARLLLEKGADVTASRGSDGKTTLAIAEEANMPQIYELIKNRMSPEGS
jgi:ankyrin repeat protein